MKRIFIADDDRDILDIMRLMLESEGYHITTSTNANELFDDKFAEVDLILLDITMSGVDGRDICLKLKTQDNTSHVPVIFISANAQLQEIARECNVYGFLAKPFDMLDLIDKVKMAVMDAVK